jgi:hypothetical protein
MIEGLPVFEPRRVWKRRITSGALILDSWPLATAKTAIYRGNLSTTAIPLPPFALPIEATKW